jgi:hypothetical protein
MEAIQASLTVEPSRKKLSFDDLPFELREMIFKDLDLHLCSRWCEDHEEHPEYGLLETIPNIIVALRQQPAPYQEILKLFCKQSTYTLSFTNNNYTFGTLSRGAIQNIRKLAVHIA